jgi:hypothetical protein
MARHALQSTTASLKRAVDVMITPNATSSPLAKATAHATRTTRVPGYRVQRLISAQTTATVLWMPSATGRLALAHAFATRAMKELVKSALRSILVQTMKRSLAIPMPSAPTLALVSSPALAMVASLATVRAALRSTTASLAAASVWPIPGAPRLDRAPMTARALLVMLDQARKSASRSTTAAVRLIRAPRR